MATAPGKLSCTVGADKLSFPFLTVSSDTGWPVDQAEFLEEEIMARGVDGKRFRELSQQFFDWEVETMAQAADYKAAINLCRSYRRAPGAYGVLQILMSGVTYNWANVHIALVAPPQAIPGPVFGPTVNGSPQAAVKARWRLTCTVIGDNAQAVSGAP